MPATRGRTKNGRLCRRWLVSGVVQGVGFRVATQRRARALGVTGWVRNTFDGRVECVGEGSRSDLDALAEFLSVGPPGAVVNEIASREETAEGRAIFEIIADAEVG